MLSVVIYQRVSSSRQCLDYFPLSQNNERAHVYITASLIKYPIHTTSIAELRARKGLLPVEDLDTLSAPTHLPLIYSRDGDIGLMSHILSLASLKKEVPIASERLFTGSCILKDAFFVAYIVPCHDTTPQYLQTGFQAPQGTKFIRRPRS